MQRFLKNEFKAVNTTQGMDFKSKTVSVSYGNEKSQIRLQIWDTAGDEKYRNIAKVYYKGA